MMIRFCGLVTPEMKQGVDPARSSAKGYGAENPIADNSTEEGREKKPADLAAGDRKAERGLNPPTVPVPRADRA
jgi:hypothetical protein